MPIREVIAGLIMLAAVVPAVVQAADSEAAASKDAASPSAHYFVMKQVKLVDQNANQGQGHTAYDLMIPTGWQFKGWVNVGVAEGGCFADWFAVVGDAKSADNSIELQIIPQYTFQYVTDPDAQRRSAAGKSAGRPSRDEAVPGANAGACGGFYPSRHD